MKIKKIARIVVLIPIAIYLLYCAYYSITEDMYPKYNDCGEIISKSNDEVAIKHGVKTELYLNIQFDNNGFRSIECNPTTYFNHNKGERVCFDLEKETSSIHKLNFMFGGIVIIGGGLFSIVCLFVYLFTNDDDN